MSRLVEGRPAGAAWSRAGLAATAVAVVVGAVVVFLAAPAAAHSFLVSTAPAQGERLASAPSAVAFEFSEEVDPATVVIALRTSHGEPVPVAAPEFTTGGLGVRVAIPDLDAGIYVVAWEALSAVDGHGTSGEFAFAVGDVVGAVPASVSSSPTDWAGAVASWLFFAGLAVAGGASVLQTVGAGVSGGPGANVVRAGLLAALSGVGLALASSGGPSLLLLLSLQALAVALLVVGFRRSAVPSLLWLVVAAVLWSGRSHGAGTHGIVGWLVDAVHLVAGTAWVGSLVLSGLCVWRLHRAGRPWRGLVRAHARLAGFFVIVLGAAGVVAAVQLLPSWEALWETRYGRFVMVKAGLFAAALVLAAAARWGLRAGWGRRIRRAMGAEAALLLGALVVAAVLANGEPPRPAGAAEELLGPAPMGEMVARDAGLAGQLNVEVAADGERLLVKVFASSGPVPGTEVGLAAVGPDGSRVDLVPRPCGPGCVTQPLALPDGLTTVTVSASAPDRVGGYYAAELVWPSGQPAGELLAEVVGRMQQVPQLELTETVSSGPGSVVTPGTFTLDGENFVSLEPYAAANVDEVRLLAGDARRLRLHVPGSQIHVWLELDDEDRIVRERLVSPGHEITRTFIYPNP